MPLAMSWRLRSTYLYILWMCAHLNYKLPLLIFLAYKMWVTSFFTWIFSCVFLFVCIVLFMSLGCNVSSVSIISLFLSLLIPYWLLRWNVEILRHPNNCAFSNFYRHLQRKLCTCFTSRTSDAVGCFWLTCLNTCVDRCFKSI